MKYLVMECHKGYAVLLDEDGKFVKAANLNYKVGQTVENIVMQKYEEKTVVHSFNRWMKPALAMAACLCIMFFGVWQYMLMPFGYVRLKINPDINMVINRNDRVVGMEALNQDGEILIDKYDYRWKDVKKVSDDMAQRAIDMGYLSEGGKITLTVSSDKEEWRIATEEKLVIELETYVGKTIEIVTKEEGDKMVIEVGGTTAASSDKHGIGDTTADKDDTDYDQNTDYDSTDYGSTDYDERSDYDDDSPYRQDNDNEYEENQDESDYHEETDGVTDYFENETSDDDFDYDSDYDDLTEDQEPSDYEDDESDDDIEDGNDEYDDSDYDDENEDDD